MTGRRVGRAEGGNVICFREVQLVGAMVTDGLNVSSIDSAILSWLKVKLEGCRWKSVVEERIGGGGGGEGYV